MKNRLIIPSRRLFLKHTSVVAAAFPVIANFSSFSNPGRFAEEIVTPTQVEGPFYPDKLPLDTDNDLLIINDSIRPSIGQITHLSGTVRNTKGTPIRNAVVEIWQCDGTGVYLHSRGGSRTQQDKNFQGFGRFTTNVKGEYYFRTIKPVPYPGRTPHIHFKIYQGGKPVLTTQMYIKDHKLNAKDSVMRLRNKDLRDLLMVDFKPLKGSKIKELTAEFNIVVGQTPDELGHSTPPPRRRST